MIRQERDLSEILVHVKALKGGVMRIVDDLGTFDIHEVLPDKPVKKGKDVHK